MSKTSFRNIFKLLEFIRKNTDKDHPVTQAGLREAAKQQLGEGPAAEMMGDKGTYSRRLHELADAYNTDADGVLLSKDEWKIVYPGYGRDKSDGKKNGKVYYSHPVNNDELDFLIKSIRETRDFSQEEKESLEKRVKSALASDHYHYDEFNGSIIRDLSVSEDDKTTLIENNISIIRSFMKKGLMIDITVLSSDDEADKAKSQIYQVSPYRIVYKDSLYWLIANWHERPAETFPENPYYVYERKFPWYTDKLTAYRIDLITDIVEGTVPDTTTVHWLMTQNMRAGKYERMNDGNPRRARNRAGMKKILEDFDRSAKEISLHHCHDIEVSGDGSH